MDTMLLTGWKDRLLHFKYSLIIMYTIWEIENLGTNFTGVESECQLTRAINPNCRPRQSPLNSVAADSVKGAKELKRDREGDVAARGGTRVHTTCRSCAKCLAFPTFASRLRRYYSTRLFAPSAANQHLLRHVSLFNIFDGGTNIY